jgi:hypothetical protein
LGQSVRITTTTNANGRYAFSNLRPGTYSVTEVQPTGQTTGGWGGGCGDHHAYMYQWCEGGSKYYEIHDADGSTRTCSTSASNSSLIDSIFNELCDHDWNDDDLGWDDQGLVDSLFRGHDRYQSFGSNCCDDRWFSDCFADFWNGISVVCNNSGNSLYLDGKDTAGSDGGVAGNDIISNIVLNWGDNGTDNNFGELLPASVAGNVYVDANNDGLKQSTEKGVAGAKITLTGTDDRGNSVRLTTVTDCSGKYDFGNLRPGTYSIAETQPTCYLDGKDTIGTQGGTVADDAFSVVLASGVKGTANNFGELKAASLSGFVFLDKNGDGDIDCRDRAIADATVTLTGVDDRGNAVSLTTTTDEDGAYAFGNLRPGTYTITETQPAGYADGADTIGSQGGIVANDQFSGIQLKQNMKGVNNNFAELAAANSALHEGQTATIGFWNSCRGQTLIKSLNGGRNATQLGNWLATMFPNMYGGSAGSHNLAGKTNAQVACYFKQLFSVCGMKLDAQAMAVSLAVYVTNSTLAGNVAAQYGFVVSSVGTGAATFSVGSAGAAFDVVNNTRLAILDILYRTNSKARNGILWDLNSNGQINCAEQTLRNLANNLFTDINETGDIG